MPTTKVIIQTRICPEAICTPASNGKKYSTKVMFRELNENADSHPEWFQWFCKKGEKTGYTYPCNDILGQDTQKPWSDLNANIYHDYCIYTESDEAGF